MSLHMIMYGISMFRDILEMVKNYSQYQAEISHIKFKIKTEITSSNRNFRKDLSFKDF